MGHGGTRRADSCGLRAIAERLLRMDAHGTPAWASVVTTTRQKALTSATPGDTIPGSGKTIVCLLTMKGRFTDYFASVPPGASLPGCWRHDSATALLYFGAVHCSTSSSCGHPKPDNDGVTAST